MPRGLSLESTSEAAGRVSVIPTAEAELGVCNHEPANSYTFQPSKTVRHKGLRVPVSERARLDGLAAPIGWAESAIPVERRGTSAPALPLLKT
jgi:hypothetical protein